MNIFFWAILTAALTVSADGRAMETGGVSSPPASGASEFTSVQPSHSHRTLERNLPGKSRGKRKEKSFSWGQGVKDSNRSYSLLPDATGSSRLGPDWVDRFYDPSPLAPRRGNEVPVPSDPGIAPGPMTTP